jgi:hypothetical protein
VAEMNKPKSNTLWYRQFKRSSPNILETALRLIDESDYIDIIMSDEAWGQGDFHYVIVPSADETFWLGAYKQIADAIAACHEAGWSMETSPGYNKYLKEKE